MKLKNTLLAFPLQIPLIFVLIFGVRFLTDLNIWWCVGIAYVLVLLYDFGETVRRGE
jgi:hypothetical protein